MFVAAQCPDSTSSCPGERSWQETAASLDQPPPTLLLGDEGKYLAAGQHDASLLLQDQQADVAVEGQSLPGYLLVLSE